MPSRRRRTHIIPMVPRKGATVYSVASTLFRWSLSLWPLSRCPAMLGRRPTRSAVRRVASSKAQRKDGKRSASQRLYSPAASCGQHQRLLKYSHQVHHERSGQLFESRLRRRTCIRPLLHAANRRERRPGRAIGDIRDSFGVRRGLCGVEHGQGFGHASWFDPSGTVGRSQ